MCNIKQLLVIIPAVFLLNSCALNSTLKSIGKSADAITMVASNDIPATLACVNEFILESKKTVTATTGIINQTKDNQKEWHKILIDNWYVIVLIILLLFFGFSKHTFKTAGIAMYQGLRMRK